MLTWKEQITEEALGRWIGSSLPDESFLKETAHFIEELTREWISEEEAVHLKTLLHRSEIDLIYRYLDLQLKFRKSSNKDELLHSIQLEKELDKYLSDPEKSLLLSEVALHCLLTTFEDWFHIKIEEGSDLKGRVRKALHTVLQREDVTPKNRYFIDEILNSLETSADPLDKMHQLAGSLQQVMLWQNALQEIHDSLLGMDQEGSITSLELLLQFFEKTLLSFHEQIGRHLSEELLPNFGPNCQAIIIGDLRKQFEKINDAYGLLKSKLTGSSPEVHLTCMCHFAAPIPTGWALNNRVVQLPASPATGCKAASGSLLIFTCGGGRGPMNATKAMAEYAKGEYHVQVANTLEDTLSSTDLLKKVLLDSSHEKLYNHLLKNEAFEWIKILTSVGPFILMLQQDSIEKMIRLEVFRHNPDVLICCFPVMNAMFLNVAKELNLPLLIVTTHLDATLFVKGMKSSHCDVTYPRYRITLAYEDADMRRIVEKLLPEEKIAITGFPLRSVFLQPTQEEERKTLKNHFQIADDEQVILVMMGGNVGLATEKYAQILSQLDVSDLSLLGVKRLRVLCLCGDQRVRENRKMLRRINQLVPRSEHVKIQGLPAVEQIPELMSLADALITKPGSCTTNEALARGLPMVFHAPFALMDWEVFNMEFCIRRQMGSRFRMHSNTVGIFKDGLTKNKDRLIPLLKEAFERRHAPKSSSADRKEFGPEFLKIVRNL